MERLRVAAPDVFNSMGLPSMPPVGGLAGSAATTAASTTPGWFFLFITSVWHGLEYKPLIKVEKIKDFNVFIAYYFAT